MNATSTHVFEQSFELSSARDRVFAALSQADQLRVWFAEHAEIERSVGGAFRFWGKHTAHGIDAALADQRLTAFEQNERLAFSWTWGGAPTRVSFDLADAPGGCTLTIRHEGDGEVAGHKPFEVKWLMEDFWTLAVGNLRRYLKTGAPALLPDHTAGSGDVSMSIEIDASAASAWRALTDPKELDRWIGHAASVDLRVGGAYSYGWDLTDAGPCGPATIIELEPGRRLVHDWSYDEDATTRTEWTVEPLGDERCRVSVRQVGTRAGKEFSGYTNGWAKFLVDLRAMLAAAA